MGLFILVVSRGAWGQWSRVATAVVQAEARGALGQGGDLGPPGSPGPSASWQFSPLCISELNIPRCRRCFGLAAFLAQILK